VFLLDTDVISDLMSATPSTKLVSRLAGVPYGQQFTSSITVGEVAYGAHRFQRRTAELLNRLEATLSGDIEVIPFDQDAAHQYGALRSDLERRGTPIWEADTRIASVALARGLTVITGNVRHFEMVQGLRVENWLV
jgi:predicted nucleic acid-binding protein